MTENVIVWTGSGFDEWDYYKVKELGIPDYAREATQEEAALYRQHAAEITRLRAENAGLREALERHGGHLDECEIEPCTCGLDAALNAEKTPDAS